MKIIFDSTEQLNRLKKLNCPDTVAMDIFNVELTHDPEDCCADRCKECWKKSGIVLEVKNENNI